MGFVETDFADSGSHFELVEKSSITESFFEKRISPFRFAPVEMTVEFPWVYSDRFEYPYSILINNLYNRLIINVSMDIDEHLVYFAFPWLATLCIFFAISSGSPRKKSFCSFILSSNSKT